MVEQIGIIEGVADLLKKAKPDSKRPLLEGIQALRHCLPEDLKTLLRSARRPTLSQNVNEVPIEDKNPDPLLETVMVK